jgi:hypothetical protein
VDGAFVSQSTKKVSSLKQHKSIFLTTVEPEVQNQGVNKTMLSLKVHQNNPSCFSLLLTPGKWWHCLAGHFSAIS